MPSINLSTPRPAWIAERKAQGRRKETNDVFYNSKAWRRLAKQHKVANPLCIQCERKGLVEPAAITDHILPINKGGARWSWDNLQSLCVSCHARKSAREGSRRGGAV